MLAQICMLFIALFCGFGVACGFVAFIILIGVIPRLSTKTHTANHVMLYENMVILGITLGNIIFLYQIDLPLGKFFLVVLGIFFGFFVGCLAGALAELVKVFPILTRRMRLRDGLPYVLVSLALGKFLGVLVQWFVFTNPGA